MHDFNHLRFVVLGLLLAVQPLVPVILRNALPSASFRGVEGSCRSFSVIALALVLLALAVLASSAPLVSLLELAFLSVTAAALLSVAAMTSSIRSVLVWQVLGGLALLGCTIYGFQALDDIYWRREFLEARDVTPGLPNVRLFSDIAAGLMPLALLYVTARSVPSRVAALLSPLPLAVWWYLLFVTEARAGILALVSAMAVAVWLFGRQARFPVTTLSVAALVGLLGWWLYNPLVAEGAESPFQRDLTTSSGRLDLWTDALRYSIEHFPFGIGPMMFAGDGQIRSAHAHNLFFNTAAEWGLPLALLLLVLVVKGCFVVVRRARTMPVGDKPLYACLVMAFVGVMVNVQFSGAHIAPLSSLVMVLAIGMALGYRHSGQPLPEMPSGPVPWSAKGLSALLVACMVYLAVAGWELYELSVASTRVCMQEADRAYLYPRFWAQGRLECMQMIDPGHWLFWSWR